MSVAVDSSINMESITNEWVDIFTDISHYIFNSNIVLSEKKDRILFLINAGVDVNIRLGHNKTALMIVSEYLDVDLVKRLIEAKADLNLQDNSGNTALICACEENYTLNNDGESIIKMLIDAGTNVHLKNKEGFNVFMYICDYYTAGHTNFCVEILRDSLLHDYIISPNDILKDLTRYDIKNEPNNLITILCDAGVNYLEYTHLPVIRLYLYRKEIEKLKQQNEELTQKCNLLQAQVDFQPGGPGYDETEKHFNELSK